MDTRHFWCHWPSFAVERSIPGKAFLETERHLIARITSVRKVNHGFVTWAFIPNTAPHSRGVGGRVPYKIAPVLRRIWDQMPQPKWCIAMGACASSGGILDNYTIMQGVDAIVPVDV